MSFDVGAPSFSAPRIDRDLAPAPPAPVAPQVAPTRPDVNFDRGVDAAEQARTSAGRLSPSSPRAAPPLPAVSDESALRRFGAGVVDGAKAGAQGIAAGATALVTDPKNTGRAVAHAVGRAGTSAADFAADLSRDPVATLRRTADGAAALGDRVANARAEDWGRFIGEQGVGLAAGGVAGKALQGVRVARGVASSRAMTAPERPPVQAAPHASPVQPHLPPSPVAQHAAAIDAMGLKPARVERIADDLAAELRTTGGTSMGPAHDGRRLAATYGGRADEWQKVSTSARQLDTAGVVTALPGQTTRGSAPVVLPNGPSTVDPTRGARHVFEAHAFRHEPTGRIVEPKLIVERPSAPAGLPSGRLVDLPMTW